MTKSKTVLLVDDEPSVLEDYKFAFANRGYEVKKAMTLEQAKKYSNENFNFVIIDGLGGSCFEVYNIINAERKIIVSGDFKLVEKAKEEGIEAYSKPICIEDILK